ncbi:unnamed protein product [Adineta ricciae]|uniref:TLDc domain-containing protein n=1 Tax=Adineta ricciae TaxID=249248 RepID=A0A814FFA5_ADIRI|nr:unnamed protein product [Adineta ricciae]CAF1349131.1 unnamed protein product [Adineta ricciae]
MYDDSEKITRQAIGRLGDIGSLYDVRTDKFEGRNLFNRQLPSSYIKSEDCAFSAYIYDENESQKDTFNKLNIDGSLKLSLMAGLLKVEGSAKYLQQTKTDSRTVRVTHILHMKTKSERLQISMADLCDYFASDAFENSNATHCIIGITWGANVAATFEQTLSTTEAAKEVQGLLSAALNTPKIEIGGVTKPSEEQGGSVKLEYNDQNNSKLRSLQISFSGDMLIQDVPKTIEDVLRIFKTVPSELKKINDGKGKQLEYELYPLKHMAQTFKYQMTIQRVINNVSLQLTNRLEDIYEQIIRGKRMINDFLNEVSPWKDWLPSDWIEAIIVKQSELNHIQTDTMRQLSTVLGQLRRGECEDTQLTELLTDFERNNPCSVLSVRKYLKANSRNEIKIDSLNEIYEHLKAVKGDNTDTTHHDLSLLFPKGKTIDQFINQHHKNEIYLLHITNEWKENDPQNWYKQIRTFGSIYKNQLSNATNQTIFRIIDHDLIPDLAGKLEKCVIYRAHLGKITSFDYYRSSLVTLTPIQIRAIRSENKLTAAMTSKNIETLHTNFIAAYPSGEIDENDFINEFQKRFPKGDPKQYCNYAFKVLDKNQSGTLSFDEYMTALSLTVPGDIEHQLTLTFQMCASSGQEYVSSEDLLQILEAVAELKGIDVSSTSFMVKTMMKFDDREVEKITKEKFIDRLKANHDMCLGFLPLYVVPIPHSIDIDAQTLFVGGTLLSDKQHQLKLNEFYGNRNQTWELVYKATDHGFSTEKFHSRCDGQGPTMIVIQSKEDNFLFGAFTQLIWSRTRGFRQDVNAFLFTLTNPHDLPPTKFSIDKSKSNNAVYHSGAGYLGELYDTYLFGFGGDGLDWTNFIDGYDSVWGTRRGDLFIANGCNENKYSNTRFPCSYVDSTGLGDKTFTGTTSFTVNDIEAYILK